MHFLLLRKLYQRLLFLLPFASEPFTYDNPENWHFNNPLCAGWFQSPIPIYTHKTVPIKLPPLVFGYYDLYFRDAFELTNNGISVKFEVPETVSGEKPYLTGGLLSDIYEAEDIHFHWGSWFQKGSEHTINGQRYDAEMHIVHKNKKYRNIEEATRHIDGIAVVGVLFKVVKATNVFYPSLNVIYNALKDIIPFNSTKILPPIQLDSLLGDINRQDFFTYQGSLTTPPCAEVVTWQIFPEVLPISFAELPKFWSLRNSRGLPILNNFRPLQTGINRKIYHSTPYSATEFSLINHYNPFLARSKLIT